MHNVVLMPWFAVEQERCIGQYSLTPYERPDEPAQDASEEAAVVRAALELFHALAPGGDAPTPVSSATVVRIGAGALTRQLTEPERAAAFDLTELVAVSALAGRDFFSNGYSYCNRDGLRVYVQRLSSASPSGGVVMARRRDGGSHDFRSRSLPTIRQHHVVSGRAGSVDWALLRALVALQADAARADVWERVLDAVRGFNAANTDADTITLGQESVLAFGAIQRLLGSGHLAREMADPLARQLAPLADAVVPPELGAVHAAAEPKAKSIATVREGWILELARVRNAFGHGRSQVRCRTYWTVHEHLLFAAIAFPLLLKRVLEGAGHYKWTGHDALALEAFEERMLSRPSRRNWESGGDGSQLWQAAWHSARYRLIEQQDQHRSPKP